MEFVITRTSLWNNKKPCEEAYQEDDIWKVKIESLENLVKFQEKYGEIIITKDFNGNPEIEIYDYYRE